MNKKGFTLIELLAVITILGILMLVAIPNITRTIENSRKDVFVDTAKSYINAIKTSVAADEIECCKDDNDNSLCETDSSKWKKISECPVSEEYRLYFATGSTGEKFIYQQAEDIMETGGKSPWGNNDLVGIVDIFKTEQVDSDPVSGTEKRTLKYSYSIGVLDSARHFIQGSVTELSRKSVETSDLDWDTMSNLGLEYVGTTWFCRLA